MLTYLLLAPHPLWVFGIYGDVVEESIDRTFTAYLQHGMAYALLAWLLIWASRAKPTSWRVLCALFAVGHAVVVESLQGFMPLRYPCWQDAAANVLGAGAGWLSAVVLFRILGRAPARTPEGAEPACRLAQTE